MAHKSCLILVMVFVFEAHRSCNATDFKPTTNRRYCRNRPRDMRLVELGDDKI